MAAEGCGENYETNDAQGDQYEYTTTSTGTGESSATATPPAPPARPAALARPRRAGTCGTMISGPVDR